MSSDSDSVKNMETMEPKEKETVRVVIGDIVPIPYFTGFNMRSGNLREAINSVVRETVSSTWHWSPIEGLNAEKAISKTYDFIRQEIARLTIHPETGVTVNSTLRRKKGIVIGVARAVLTETYRIVADDLVAGEIDTSKLAVGDDGNAIVIKDDVDAKWKEELSKPLNLSETEKKVIPKLHLLALGMIPLQGYFMMTMPLGFYLQYMDELTLVEKQVWGGCDQFSWWWKEDAYALRDAMWHKAGHPVKISFMKETACSNTVKKLLVEAGLGSVATKLPFLEPEVKKAKSYRTVLETVLPVFKSVGGDIKWETLDEMLAYLEHFPVARPTEMVTVNNAPTHLRSLDTREKVVAWIEQWCTRNAKNVAFYFGFYMTMAKKGGQFEGTYTLKKSYALRALQKTDVGYYYLGTEHFLDYCAYKAMHSQDLV